MRDRDDDDVVCAFLRVAHELDAVLFPDLAGVDPGVVNIDARAVGTQFAHNVDDLGIAHVRAVLLERHPEYQDAGIQGLHTFCQHALDDARRDVQRHVIVDAPARENHLRVITELLRLVGQVIRIDADAMPADESRAKRQEVPLRAGGLEHFLGIDADALEDHRELVDQCDVDVALRVLDDFCGFGNLDARRPVRAGRDDRAIDGIDEVGGRGCRARRDLEYRRQPMFLVARVDALRAVADEEVLVQGQAGLVLENRHAELFSRARINRGLVDDDVAFLDNATQRRTRCF